MADVPSVFLEYLRSAAIVSCVDDDIDYYIKFNHDQHIQADTGTLRKATAGEKEKYESIENKVKELKKGDRVHLDIGPPNYVQSVITQLDLDPVVKMALTRSAVLVGFINPYVAVVEYEGGLRCRVKKKLLTVLEKFHIGLEGSKDTLTLETAGRIRAAISRSVEDIHSREGAPTKDWKVEVILMFHGNPPCIEFKIISTVATSKAVFNWLDQNSGWKVEFLGDEQFMIRGADTSDLEIKVGIVFNDEKSDFFPEPMQSKDSRPEMVSGSYEEGARPKNKAQGYDTEEVERPVVNSVEQFEYLRLYNPALAKNVYFPYVIHGRRRDPIEPLGPTGEQSGVTSVVTNIGHVQYYNPLQ